jgi:hypothetical protein
VGQLRAQHFVFSNHTIYFVVGLHFKRVFAFVFKNTSRKCAPGSVQAQQLHDNAVRVQVDILPRNEHSRF